MLNKVSLLPQEYLNKIAQKEKHKKIMMATIAITAVIAFSAVAIFIYKISLIANLNNIKSENTAQTQKIAELAEFENMEKEMTSNKKIIADIQSTDNEWMSKIYQTTITFPRGIVIKKIETFIETNQCNIECYSSTYGEVSDLIANLEKLEIIENIKCETLNSDGEQVSFKLTIDYAGSTVADSEDSESSESSDNSENIE
ncbi:MAG: hypothetical protein RSE93_02605 [Oscillospiraceae bacterium]